MAETLERHFQNPRTATEREIAEMGPWFHNLHLPDGTQTAPDHPLGDFPAFKWEAIEPHIPPDLSGVRVLDVGCNAGYYTLQMARRGAEVHAIDLDERYLDQARWAAGQFDLKGEITFEQMQVYDLARRNERYDVVLFLGVFYHLRYPLLALDLLARATLETLVFQSLSAPEAEGEADLRDRAIDDREALMAAGWPKMAFVEGRFAGDPTNWWVPNAAAMEAMLRSSGLRVVARPEGEIFLCEPDPQARNLETWPFTRGQIDAVCGRGGEDDDAA